MSFGLFEADLIQGELRRRGRLIKLQDQPFQLLTFLVRRAGEVVSREELKNALWPADTFVDFDQAVNTAVKKIRQALRDSADNPRFIETLPRKGYRFIAPVTAIEEEPAVEAVHEFVGVPATEIVDVSPAPRPPLTRWRAAAAMGAAGLLLTIATLWFFVTRKPQPVQSLIPVPLTSYQGDEIDPSFSPDGNQVAFSWDGEKKDRGDIYVKLIASDSLLQLTSASEPSINPAWSPDGRSIAFLRVIGDERRSVLLIPAIGGAERKIAEISCGFLAASSLSWSPDGKWLAVPDQDKASAGQGIFRLSVEDGEKLRLTTPPKGQRDAYPAIAPDGKTLLFVRSDASGSLSSNAFTVPLSEEGVAGNPTQVTFHQQGLVSPTWTADGRGILFSATKGPAWLWKSGIPPKTEPEQLVSLGEFAVESSMAPKLHRLVYTRNTTRVNTFQLKIPGVGRKASDPVRVLDSTRFDYNSQYSPDGKRIAFSSTRSGYWEIWVCDNDGSHARQLTSLKAPVTGSSRWSPKGDQLVFDSNVSGNFELYTISPDGGKPRRLTFDPADDAVGSWSRDGQWIYFMSRRSGEEQVWKMTPDGGTAIQLTRHGGYVAFESPDRGFVYYSKHIGITTLWRTPVQGGEEVQVLPSVWYIDFAVTSTGVYFVKPASDGPESLQFLNFKTGKTADVAPIGGGFATGLAVSPDERNILYSKAEGGRDLMLVENFR